MALFWEITEPLRSEAWLTEVDHWAQAYRLQLALVLVLGRTLFLVPTVCDDVAGCQLPYTNTEPGLAWRGSMS